MCSLPLLSFSSTLFLAVAVSNRREKRIWEPTTDLAREFDISGKGRFFSQRGVDRDKVGKYELDVCERNTNIRRATGAKIAGLILCTTRAKINAICGNYGLFLIRPRLLRATHAATFNSIRWWIVDPSGPLIDGSFSERENARRL